LGGNPKYVLSLSFIFSHFKSFSNNPKTQKNNFQNYEDMFSKGKECKILSPKRIFVRLFQSPSCHNFPIVHDESKTFQKHGTGTSHIAVMLLMTR
jgi:hypothetical protein